MLRRNNYITFLLTVIVVVLILGLGVTIYYVLDLDWFSKKPIDIYNEVKPNVEIQKPAESISKDVFDMTKRKYDLELNTTELKIVAYKDGNVGITMKENDKYKDIKNYTEFLNKEIKLSAENIIKVYEVTASKDNNINKYIVFVDRAGNLYKLVEESIINDGKYDIKKIEGLIKIVDIKQITNTNVEIYKEGINVIAIDNENNEILLTDYLLK